MDEFKFVFRSLFLAAIVLFISQYKINNETIEAKAEYAFVNSQMADHLREVAAGGAKFIKKTTLEGVEFLKNKMSHSETENQSEKK